MLSPTNDIRQSILCSSIYTCEIKDTRCCDWGQSEYTPAPAFANVLYKYVHHKAQAGIQSVQDLQKDIYSGCFSRERLLDGLENALECVVYWVILIWKGIRKYDTKYCWGDRSMYQNKHKVRYEWIRKGTNEAKGNHLDIDRTTLAM